MSAIFGLLGLDRAPVDPQLLARMDDALSAEGPDHRGCWADGPVALGARIRCFTPEDRQDRPPALSAGGRLRTVLDGRIDNRSELARLLGMDREEARRLPDSGFVLRAYERWGERCIERLVGEFTFALWDGRRQQLTAARSAPLGRPFFYRHTERMVAFASRPRGLFALPGVRRELDEEHAAQFLSVLDPGESSFYRGVRCLRAGQLLIAGAGGVRAERWWRPEHGKEIRFKRDEDYLEAFEELLDRVVAEHLRADRPHGAFLSGGLDSSSVAASAAHALAKRGRRLNAYTEVPPQGFQTALPPGRYGDETPYVRALARHCPGIELRLVDSDGRGLLDDAERFFAAAEAPFVNTTNRAYIEAIHARARDDGVGVMLTGDAGNFTISWDGCGLLPQLLRRLRIARAVREARALARAGAARSGARALVGRGLWPLLPARVNGTIDRLRAGPQAAPASPWHVNTLIAPAFAAAHQIGERKQELPSRHTWMRDTRALRLALLRQSDIVAEVKAAYRSIFGIDARHPLADRRLVEFCVALPEEQHGREGQTRLLVRRGMAGRLPPEILANRGRGLQAAYWLERLHAERPALLDEVARFERNALTSRVLDLARLRTLLERLPRTITEIKPQEQSLHRFALGFALVFGRFLLWVEQCS